MKLSRTYVKCGVCSHDIAESSFKKHLERHYDPRSRLCKFWYKEYFTNDNGVIACKFCDEEIHPEIKTSRFEYEEHLKKEHNINVHNMKINGKTVEGNSYAFDGCHKLYVCENEEDEREMKELGYSIYPIEQLKFSWEDSCGLRFIHNAQLTTTYVEQGEEAVFEWKK